MKKAPIIILLFISFSVLYSKYNFTDILHKTFFEVKTNYDFLDDHKFSGTDSLYPGSGDATDALSFSLELFYNISRLSLGGGITYQIPVYHEALGDFHFIPVYWLAKIRIFGKEENFSTYLLYNYGKNYHQGSFNYTRGSELKDGKYRAFGIGLAFGRYFVLELSKKSNTGERANEELNNKIYNMDVDYSTISLSIGVKNDISQFFKNYY